MLLDTAAYAVDSWQGDPHAGFYDSRIYEDVYQHNQSYYSGFSKLLRTTFDDALPYFAAGEIDLLHIDGYHTYESVSHDFHSWLPKLSGSAVVLLHDINVRENDFGVWRLWEEIAATYPSFAFHHHHGLGVACVGPVRSPDLNHLLAADRDPIQAAMVRNAFAQLGQGIQATWEAGRHAEQVAQLQQRVSVLAHDCEALQTQTAQQSEDRNTLAGSIERLAAEQAESSRERVRLIAELERVQGERELLAGDCAQGSHARDKLAAELEQVLAERDRLAAERAALLQNQQRLAANHALVLGERDRARATVATVAADLEAAREEMLRQTNECKSLERQLVKHRRRRQRWKMSLFWRAARPVRAIVGTLRKRSTRTRDETSFPEVRQRLEQDPAEANVQATVSPYRDSMFRYRSLLPVALQSVINYTAPEPFRATCGALAAANHAPRIACLVHVFYVELWDELASYIRSLRAVNHDIYVNFVDATVSEDVMAQAIADFPNAKTIVSPNRGRDAGGIFRLLGLIDPDRYDGLVVLHGKRSATLPEEYGRSWRHALIEPLLGSETIARLNAGLLATDPTVGLIGSASCCSTFVGENATQIDMLCRRLNIPPNLPQDVFVAGSMFFIRPQIMLELSHALRESNFMSCDDSTAAVLDGQLEHAIERLYGTLVAHRGQRIVWRDTRCFHVDLGL